MAGMDLDGLDDFQGTVGDMQEDIATDDLERVVGTNVEYAPPVEFGSAPHVITGDPLAFEGEGGETVFPTRVNHPGTDPQPHVRPGIRATDTKLAELAVAADSMEEFLDLAALTAVAEVKRRTPVDSGNLRASYRILD